MSIMGPGYWATGAEKSRKCQEAGTDRCLPKGSMTELLADVASPRWRRVYLTHLSRDCNSPAAVEAALADVRAILATCEFAIVGPGEGTPFYELV